jgi:aspartyl-tRNA(Asn)/glutamyl-tRNA(Gln) amidotransferase subunit C
MTVNAETVRHVAKLARIRLEPDQETALATELSNILNWVEQLNELDTDGVEPMTSVAAMRLKTRKDEVTDGNRQAEILANAPETKHGFFLTPRVVE